jgi:hypothetical protein
MPPWSAGTAITSHIAKNYRHKYQQKVTETTKSLRYLRLLLFN